MSNSQLHMTTTNTDINAKPSDKLRAALKQAGFNARRVTVKYDHTTLRVTIRDASVSLTKVEEIAGPFERVRRCQVTGETLLGGNTYVEVAYDKAVIKPLKDEIATLLANAPFDEYVAVRGDFRALRVSGVREEIRLKGPGIAFRSEIAYGTVWAAERLAIAYLDAMASQQGEAA
jgi:hypothetical protein